MKIIKVGIAGLGRGMSFATPHESLGIEVKSLCDSNEAKLKKAAKKTGITEIFSEYDKMLESDIDAVILTNYFDEHAGFAIKALEAGKHVMSECTSNVTVAEGVQLCRAVEKSGKVYMLAENYPYSKAMMELRRIYKTGEIGKVLYGDGEYNHPMPAETINMISPGEYHWRNTIPATYYCTHALAPLMAATDTMPVSVNALAIADATVFKGTARRKDPGSIILCRMDNGAIFKLFGTSIPGESRYYRMHGTHGAIEIERRTGQLHIWHDEWDIPEGSYKSRTYMPGWPELGNLADQAGHSGGDFWTLHYFTKAIRENTQPYLNVYRAAAMSSVGIQAWKSALQEGAPFKIPNFMDENSRKLYENDNWNPILKKGMSRSQIPSASITGYEPTSEDLAAAKAVWERENSK